jgi:hypothetical protein
MTPENFCYWLQGYIEISETKTLTSEQLQVVWEHLNLVFNKVTSMSIPQIQNLVASVKTEISC